MDSILKQGYIYTNLALNVLSFIWFCIVKHDIFPYLFVHIWGPLPRQARLRIDILLNNIYSQVLLWDTIVGLHPPSRICIVSLLSIFLWFLFGFLLRFHVRQFSENLEKVTFPSSPNLQFLCDFFVNRLGTTFFSSCHHSSLVPDNSDFTVRFIKGIPVRGFKYFYLTFFLDSQFWLHWGIQYNFNNGAQYNQQPVYISANSWLLGCTQPSLRNYHSQNGA